MLLCKHVKNSLAFLAVAFVLLEPVLESCALFLSRPQVAFAAPPPAAAGQGVDATSPSPPPLLLLLLTPKTPVTRELSAAEVHIYQIALDAGQYFHALIEQRGIDAGVTLAAPDGQTLVRLDCRRREPTPISLIVALSGTYRLEVRAPEEKDARGHYELRMTESRPATATDMYRIAAEKFSADAERLLKDGEKESSRAAINKYQAAADSWQTAGDRREEARALRRIADVHLSSSEYQPALAHYNRALSLSKGTNDTRRESEAINGLAYVYLTLGQNQRALALSQRALKLSRATSNRHTEAQAIHNIGEIQYGLGNLPRSIDFFQQALPLWSELGDRQGQALSFLNLGYTYSDLGQIREAFDSYNQALALWQTARDRRGEAMTLTATGRLYSRIGESQEALNFFERAMPLIQRVGDPLEEARVLTGMAYVYRSVGEQPRAIEYYERAASLFRIANYPHGEASTLGSAGAAYHALGDSGKALEYHQRALAMFRELSDRRMEMIELKKIGRLYDSRGDKTEALKNYLRAFAFEHAGKDLREETDTLNLIGRIYEGQGRIQQALDCYNRALSLSRAAEHRSGEAATLYNIARVERTRGDLSAARVRAEDALEVVESLRGKVASQNLRASYFASVRQLYELYIDLLMDLHGQHPAGGYDAAAFEASERARARSLLETLAAARVGVREKTDPELLARERALRNELDEKTERRMNLPAAGQADATAAAFAEEINKLKTQYREVSAQVRTASLEHTAQAQPRPLSLKEIRERDLDDDDTLLLEFSLGEARSYLWLVSKDSLRTYELPPRATIEDAANRVRNLLIAPAPIQGEAFDARQARVKEMEEAYWREAAALSEMLLAPAAGNLGTKRLLIVPDGALQYIPFNALPVPGRSSSSSSGGGEPTPLLVEHEITHQPSASALATLRTEDVRRQPKTKTVAVFADPVFEADDSRLGRALEASSEMSSRRAQTRGTDAGSQVLRDVSSTWNGGSIPRLFASRNEAEAILSVTRGGENLKAVGFDADKAAAISPELGQYRIIHFATHGILDSEHPELSGLLLSRYDRRGHLKEGFLRLDDIYNLNLPADLVVLSACDTGLGKDVKGEGLVGLVRGFMYAGTSRVVASLWKVDDDATAELMTHFYREMLQEKKSPAAALRAAQVALWRQRRWHAPYFWAAFVLQGEYGGRIEVGQSPGRIRASWLLVIAALVISPGCLYLWWRQKRGRKKTYEQ